VTVVGEPVERTLGNDRIVKERDPLFDRAVGGHDGRGTPVSFDDDLVEIAGLLRVEPAESEVIDDEEVGRQQAAEEPLGRVIGTGLMDLLQQIITAKEEDAVPGTTGTVPEGTGEGRLADADRPEEDDVFPPVEKLEREELADTLTVKGDRHIPVKLLEGLLVGKAGAGEPRTEVFCVRGDRSRLGGRARGSRGVAGSFFFA
jgi:hypothetical protein